MSALEAALAPSKNLLTCAAKWASNHSIAAGLKALGIGNNGGAAGFLVDTFGGNTFSGITFAAMISMTLYGYFT